VTTHIHAFVPQPAISSQAFFTSTTIQTTTTKPLLSIVSLASTSNNNDNNNNDNNNNNQDDLSEKFGGYTVKQRLREEVESPFRKVRLLFFGSSAGSALTALYFSATSALKASPLMASYGYTDIIPLDEALTSCAINLGGAIVCGFLALREYNVGKANLERIARGGMLARLTIDTTMDVGTGGSGASRMKRVARTLSDYRRTSRVLLAVGGKEYVEEVCKSFYPEKNSGNNANDNNNNSPLADSLADVDVLVVPVLIEPSTTTNNNNDANQFNVADTRACWKNAIPATVAAATEGDNNLDDVFLTGDASSVLAFPRAFASWSEYLQPEIETATKQGFDVLNKGFTITVKKNGRILRRTTGLPQWTDFISTMEVMDGSKFGMPGDSKIYEKV